MKTSVNILSFSVGESMPLLEEFLDHIRLAPLNDNQFIGHNRHSGSPGHIFGGQVLGQALSAASQTVDNRLCHSLSSQFLKRGDFDKPIQFTVQRIRDGRSFSNRQVTASQDGEVILTLESSFQVEMEGLSFQPALPDVAPPEQLPGTIDFKSDFEAINRQRLYDFLVPESLFEFRYTDKPSFISSKNRPPYQQVWFRSKVPVTEQPGMLRAILAYISDLNFIRTASLPFLEDAGELGFQMVSLNHSMWIHGTPDFSEWMLFDMRGTLAVSQRALVTGQIFTQQGTLVATAVQEGLLRRVDPSKSSLQMGPE